MKLIDKLIIIKFIELKHEEKFVEKCLSRYHNHSQTHNRFSINPDLKIFSDISLEAKLATFLSSRE